MPPQETPQYMLPDFDPWKMKMDKIRDILIQHGVKPTGMISKQEMVDLFNLHIKPQAAELRAKHESIVPTEEGIIKVSRGTKGKGTIVDLYDGDNDDSDSRPTRKAVKTKRSTSKLRSHEEISSAPRPKRSSSRVMSNKSDAESTEEKTRGRKPRKSNLDNDMDVTRTRRPTTRSRSKEPLDKKKTKKSSNFSDENPFQSGNDSERTRSKSRDSTTTTTSRTRSTSRSKKAAATGKESVRPPVFKEPELPAFGRYMHTPEIPSDKEISVYPTSPSLRKRSKRVEVDHPKPKPFNITAKEEANFLDQDWGQYLTLIGCTLAAVLLSYILWYRQTRFHIGFCPASVDQNTSQSGNWFYPSCIPCPDHAVCLTPDSDPVCSPEYILKPQLLSFGGLLPLSPVCVLNRAKEYQSFQIADAAERWVHNYGGKAECGFTPLAPKVKLARQRILEKDLQQHMEQLKESTVSETDFQEYWDMAMKELHRRADKVVFEKTEDGNVTIRSLKPRKTIACRLRQALFAWIVKFKFAFSCMVLSLIGAIVLRRKIVQRQKRNRIVNGLVANVLSKLSNQAHYYYVDPVLYSEPFLPQLHLRDALLANVHSPVERQELWTRVESIVEKNSNVRIGSQEVRGEPHRTWEWIGASNILGDSSYDAIGDKQNGVRRGIDGGMGVGTSVGSSSSYARGNVPAVPTRTGPHGSFFGMRRVDSEFMNPLNPMYPSLSQEYDSYERE